MLSAEEVGVQAPTQQKVLDDIVAAARAAFPVHRVYLFGSRVTGRSAPDSDFDVLVVATTNLAPLDRVDAIRRRLLHLAVSLDIIVVTQDEFARLVGWRSSVVYSAVATGEVLYAAAQ